MTFVRQLSSSINFSLPKIDKMSSKIFLLIIIMLPQVQGGNIDVKTTSYFSSTYYIFKEKAKTNPRACVVPFETAREYESPSKKIVFRNIKDSSGKVLNEYQVSTDDLGQATHVDLVGGWNSMSECVQITSDDILYLSMPKNKLV